MSSIHIIHALDSTTGFLSVFKKYFNNHYFTIEPTIESLNESLSFFERLPEECVVVFLGHGHSTGLYSPQSDLFKKELFINVEKANKFFNKRIVILLTCNSNQFIEKITNYKYIIGFGNILSSMQEVISEGDVSTGIFRNLSKEDLEFFNDSYCYALVKALKKFELGLYNYGDIPKLIEYFINQSIIETLLKKEICNRVEIAKLLYEFRNEMKFY